MGQILSIRLSAVTYDEDAVSRAWPRLCALAWPNRTGAMDGKARPLPAAFAPPLTADPVRRGVVELVQALQEAFRFGDWDAGLQQRLEAGMGDLGKAATALAKALEDWQPQAANTASNAMEDSLDFLEEKCE